MTTPVNPDPAGRSASPPVIAGFGRATPPGGTSIVSQLETLSHRALSGGPEDIERLCKWSSLVEQEAYLLRKRLRKQQHDFATLFEIVGQTSARSLDVVAMQTYLLRTVSGHFATTRLLIMRRLKAEDQELTCSAAQGVRDPDFKVAIDSPLCNYAVDKRVCFPIKEVPGKVKEVAQLSEWGVDLVVPLVQEVEGAGAVLEGLLILGPRLGGHAYNDEDIEFLQVLGKMLAICLRNEALYRRSIIDDLTGVASRGHFDAQLSQELNRIMTYGHRSLGLVMLDVDEFKHFNDTYGHQTGDRVLQELARLLVHQVRNVDLVARYGGEEFAIILLEIDRAKVMEVAERLRKSVEDMEVTSAQGQKLRITSSFGLAVFPDDATEKSTLIQLADEALYRSKAAGRNQVTGAVPGSGLNRGVHGPRPSQALPRPTPTPTSAAVVRKPGGLSGLWTGVTSPDIENIRKQQLEISSGVTPASKPRDERRRTAIYSRPRDGGENQKQ